MSGVRYAFFLISLLATVGCASRPSATMLDRHEQEAVYNAPLASPALAFDPPAGTPLPEAVLARDDRQPWAFAYFAGPSVEVYDIHTDDNQLIFGSGGGRSRDGRSSGGNSGYYQRRALIDRSGINYR